LIRPGDTLRIGEITLRCEAPEEASGSLAPTTEEQPTTPTVAVPTQPTVALTIRDTTNASARDR
ncbi:MAG TPA: hypothetical protein VKQ36_01910, partial [Ktedonobacterales bacterium]|nr:hypothetical protein [Ktedonobacterales bacterium]